jgi:hypothetical protein
VPGKKPSTNIYVCRGFNGDARQSSQKKNSLLDFYSYKMLQFGAFLDMITIFNNYLLFKEFFS